MISVAASACSRETDSLEIFFEDELVEAPARSTHIVGLTGADCEAILSVPHDRAQTAGTVIYQATGRYPLDPSLDLLSSLPRGSPFALDIAVYDAEEILMARACEIVTLDPAMKTMLRIELHALPFCPNRPATVVDVVLVLDTSTAMAVADTEKTVLADLRTRVVEGTRLPAGSTWSIITHGHTAPPAELLAPTTDIEAVKSAIDALIPTQMSGAPLVYDAVSRAAAVERARAVCGRKPAILAILGGRDGGSERLAEDAAIGIIGTRDDVTDDIYTFGLGLTRDTYDVLKDFIPEEIGVATGAETDFLRKSRLSEAAMALRALVP